MAKMSSITDCLMFAIVLLVATTLFIFHSLTILSRYWGNSVTETVHSVRNSSLILPVVHMQFETQRQSPVPNETVFQTMHFKAQLDDRELPFWASPVKHTEFRSQSANGWYHSITVNRISMKDMKDRNYTLNYVRANDLWPLRTRRAGGGGYKIMGKLNATDYIEDGTIDVDSITVVISSPYSDSASTAAKIAFFRLFPCERLTVVLQYEERNLLNRPESPCRDDLAYSCLKYYNHSKQFMSLLRGRGQYPDTLKNSTFRSPALRLTDFYNPINYPDLPYDKLTCEHLCVSRYWAKTGCGCFMFSELRQYSGAGGIWPMCETTYNEQHNCTLSFAYYRTPAEVIQKCQCYDKCTDVKFNVVGQQQNHYNYDTYFCPNETHSETIVEVYYSDLSYRVVTEEEAYPLKEMINEWAGITGLYFGFSILSIFTMIRGTIVTWKKKNVITAKVARKISSKIWKKSSNNIELYNTRQTQGTVTHEERRKQFRIDQLESELVQEDMQRRLSLFESRLVQLETVNAALQQKLNFLGD